MLPLNPMQHTTIESALREAARRLARISERPRLEAEILMAHRLGKGRIWLHAHSDERLPEPEAYEALVTRRERGEPVEYITGRVSFYDMELEVGEGVLIPRPETELLVEMAASIIEKEKIPAVCEIGVGSGAVTIALARRFPDLKIVATDISDKALACARQNVRRFGLEERVSLVQSDLMSALGEVPPMVVSNPPYIARDYLLPQPVRYEPREALIGGERGDEILLRIVDEAQERGVGHLVCEMGYDQREAILAHCRARSLPDPRFYRDLAGLDRGFYLTIPGNLTT